MILWDHRYLQSPLNLIAIRFWKVKVQNKVENISDNVDVFFDFSHCAFYYVIWE